MESVVRGRSVIDIRATVEKKKMLLPSYLQPKVHALPGCAITSYLYGTGKVTVLKALKRKCLNLLGAKEVDMELVVSQASSFIAARYGS